MLPVARNSLIVSLLMVALNSPLAFAAPDTTSGGTAPTSKPTATTHVHKKHSNKSHVACQSECTTSCGVKSCTKASACHSKQLEKFEAFLR